MGRHRLVMLITCLAFGALIARADKPNFTGTWVFQPSKSEVQQRTGWLRITINQDESQIHYAEQTADDVAGVRTEFTCGTLGKECPMLDHGHQARVGVYYNGERLVVYKTEGRKGDVVTKRRLLLAPGGDSMELEVIHIVPDGKTEKLVLRRLP